MKEMGIKQSQGTQATYLKSIQKAKQLILHHTMNNLAANSSIQSINTDQEMEEEKTEDLGREKMIKVNNSAIKLNCRCEKCENDMN